MAKNEFIRLIRSLFAFTILDARMSKSSGTEREHKKFVDPVSTIIRFLTHKDGDLSTYFDIIDENEDGNNISLLKQLLNKNRTKINRRLT